MYLQKINTGGVSFNIIPGAIFNFGWSRKAKLRFKSSIIIVEKLKLYYLKVPQVLGSHQTDRATEQIESSPKTSQKFWLFEHVYQVQRKKSQQLSGFTAALHWPWKQSCRILRLKKQLKYYTLYIRKKSLVIDLVTQRIRNVKVMPIGYRFM